MSELLAGIRVLDVGSFVAGPAAATVMSDFGAGVIKVEPLDGDAYRTLLAGAPVDYFWLLDARNKRSLALDVKQPEGHALLTRLIERCDVLVTNYWSAMRQRGELGVAPLAHSYRTADSRWLQLSVLNPAKEWAALARALDHPEWVTDPRFVSAEPRRAHAAVLVEAIAEAVAYRTLADLRRVLDAAAITYGFAAQAAELVHDAQLRANAIVVETAQPAPDYPLTISSPIAIDGETKRVPTRAPAIGEHTREILAELGESRVAIEALFTRGVVRE